MLKAVIFWLEFTLSFFLRLWTAFNTKFGSLWKDRESSYQERKILAPFCKLVTLILEWNCVKIGLRVTKIVKQIKFEWVWDELEAKNLPKTIIHKIFETKAQNIMNMIVGTALVGCILFVFCLFSVIWNGILLVVFNFL